MHHAQMRMKQRAMTELEVEHVLTHPVQVLNSFDGTRLAVGIINQRTIRVKFLKTERYLLIITAM